jgi:sodium-dependent phosphate cotransporter
MATGVKAPPLASSQATCHASAPLCHLDRRTVSPSSHPLKAKLTRVLIAALLAYAFVLGIETLGSGFQLLGGDVVQGFFRATANPFAGLAIGILATSVVQSSSVTTSMIVALVAAPGAPLPISHAVPMIMGANIGTTVTNTVVALGHLTRPTELERAMAVGTIDDFFNLVALVLLLPLELATGFLQRSSAALVAWIPRGADLRLPNPIAGAGAWAQRPLEEGLVWALGPPLAGVASLFVAAALIFVSLTFIVKLLRDIGESRLGRMVADALDRRPVRAFAIGVLATALVQSSSIVLSFLVPFAGSGVITLEQAFPVALGANVGTTVTALFAAMAVPPERFALAVQIALVHLLFNTVGTLLIYPFRVMRDIPLGLSRWIGRVSVTSRSRAIAYIVVIFFGLPGALLVMWRW